MSTGSIKFSNEKLSTPISWTVDLQANGQDTSVTSLSGYSTSSVAGKQITAIQLTGPQGLVLQVKTDGAGRNDKQAKTNGNNVIQYDPAIGIDSLRLNLVKQ